MSWLLQTLVGVGHPCLFVGEAGTSKSVTIASYLSGLGGSHITLNMNFSSRTTSQDVQHAIEDSIEKRTKVCHTTLCTLASFTLGCMHVVSRPC
jgi:dynein heavy chain